MFVYLNNKAGLRALGHHGHPGIVGRVGAHPGGSGARGPDGPYHPFPVQISSAALFSDFQTLMKIIKKRHFLSYSLQNNIRFPLRCDYLHQILHACSLHQGPSSDGSLIASRLEDEASAELGAVLGPRTPGTRAVAHGGAGLGLLDPGLERGHGGSPGPVSASGM